MSIERVILPSSVTPKHYKLELTPDLVTLEYVGSEHISVFVSSSTSIVQLHSKEIQVLSASFKSNSSDKKLDASEITYRLKENIVSFTFSEELALGDGVLSLSFRGILNSDMAGFYKSSYVDSDGNKQVMASTQFEALDARRAFPCWDEPLLKATFSVTLVIATHLTAISNMPEISVEHLPNGKKRITFDDSPLMSTYLLAWAVGVFDFVQSKSSGGVNIRVFSPPGRSHQGLFALEVGKKALDFYDDYFQVKYPLPKLDMLCVTEFAAGAMENWGLVTYREVDLMIDPVKASSQQKQRVAIVVTHELAHQWFGNLVTMQWWDDLWLNEGFACYMEHFATDALFPEYHIWEQYTTDAMGAALRLDSLRSSHPIQVPIKHAEEVEQVFDAISYCKGSTVVRMVAALLGPEKFQEGLRQYMSRHQYKNTVTTDLWQAWSDVSGTDVAGLMASWTSQMGFPYLTVVEESWTDSEVAFTLEQKWFLSDGSGADDDNSKLWAIPLLFATNASVSSVAVVMSDRRQTFKIPLGPVENGSAEQWLKINAGQQALVRVAHSPTMTSRIQGAIRQKLLGAEDRAALLLDAYALAKANATSIEAVVELLRAFDQETNATVWSALEGILGGLQLLMEQVGGAANEAFLVFAKRIVRGALERVGWDGKEGEQHSDKLQRASILGLVESFCSGDEDVVVESKRKFDEHWERPEALAAEYKSIVYRIVLKNGSLAEFDRLITAYNSTEDNSLRKFVLVSIGATQQPELQKRTLDWAISSGQVKLQDFFYPIRAVAFSSGAGSDLTWKYFRENLAVIRAKLAKAVPSLMDAVIVSVLSRFCTSEQAANAEAFFVANPVPSSARRISQTLEAVRVNGAVLERIKSSKLADPAFWN